MPPRHITRSYKGKEREMIDWEERGDSATDQTGQAAGEAAQAATLDIASGPTEGKELPVSHTRRSRVLYTTQ